MAHGGTDYSVSRWNVAWCNIGATQLASAVVATVWAPSSCSHNDSENFIGHSQTGFKWSLTIIFKILHLSQKKCPLASHNILTKASHNWKVQLSITKQWQNGLSQTLECFIWPLTMPNLHGLSQRITQLTKQVPQHLTKEMINWSLTKQWQNGLSQTTIGLVSH